MINVNEMSKSFYSSFMMIEALCKPKCFYHLSKWPIIILTNLYTFIQLRDVYIHSFINFTCLHDSAYYGKIQI